MVAANGRPYRAVRNLRCSCETKSDSSTQDDVDRDHLDERGLARHVRTADEGGAVGQLEGIRNRRGEQGMAPRFDLDGSMGRDEGPAVDLGPLEEGCHGNCRIERTHQLVESA